MTPQTTNQTDTGYSLTLRLSSNTCSVSALSSMLRTLQAAIRDAASRSQAAENLSTHQPAPLLMVRTSSQGEALTLSLVFAVGGSEPLEDVSAAAFSAFMEEISEVLSAQPHMTLWGTRPKAGGGPASKRMQLFLDDIVRLGEVELEAQGHRVRFTSSGISMGQG